MWSSVAVGNPSVVLRDATADGLDVSDRLMILSWTMAREAHALTALSADAVSFNKSFKVSTAAQETSDTGRSTAGPIASSALVAIEQVLSSQDSESIPDDDNDEGHSPTDKDAASSVALLEPGKRDAQIKFAEIVKIADDLDKDDSNNSVAMQPAASSKVHPLDDAISEATSSHSKSSIGSLHQSIEQDQRQEEPVLRILRYLLVVVMLVVVALSLTTTTISKQVISKGITTVNLVTQKGDRQAHHAVRGPSLTLFGVL
jgi:hypothetical protein